MKNRNDHYKIFKQILVKYEYPSEAIPEILESLKIQAIRLNFIEAYPEMFSIIERSDQELCGALYYSRDRDRIYILLHDAVKDPVAGFDVKFTEREKFTIMHELGHYFLEGIFKQNLDELYEGFIFYRDLVSTKGTNKKEMNANHFAAEILVPEQLLTDFIQIYKTASLDPRSDKNLIASIAKRFGVSKTCMTIRLKNLRFYE